MPTLPKAIIRRCSSRLFTAFFDPSNHRWRVTLGDTTIAEFDNHPDALTYAHRRATTAQRKHVEKLEHDAYEARRAVEDNPKVKLGDRVAFDAFGRKAIGTVTRCGEDGITIREERW